MNSRTKVHTSNERTCIPEGFLIGEISHKIQSMFRSRSAGAFWRLSCFSAVSRLQEKICFSLRKTKKKWGQCNPAG